MAEPTRKTESSVGGSCSNCGAPLSSDQRYCLSCGEPSSPLRLAFLDVLQNEGRPTQTTTVTSNERNDPSNSGWLQKLAPVLALLSTLLLAVIVGLLVGHWVTQDKKATGPQVIKIEGLTLAAPATTTTTTPATETPAEIEAKSKAKSKTESKTKSKAQEEKEEEAEAKAEEKNPPKVKTPVTITPKKVEELNKSTGKKHEEEINKLGNQPIEVK